MYMYYCIAAVHADASLTQVRERQMSNAAERGGRLCLFVTRSALSLALQVLNGTPQSEVTPHVVMFFRACSRIHRIIRRCHVKNHQAKLVVGFFLDQEEIAGLVDRHSQSLGGQTAGSRCTHVALDHEVCVPNQSSSAYNRPLLITRTFSSSGNRTQGLGLRKQGRCKLRQSAVKFQHLGAPTSTSAPTFVPDLLPLYFGTR
ncbi:jg8327 [Pararge aegeria aegeria]|uniref:Jg8327 protein n=1 Tax=Pararge aegeria aegeria TaxID=348720 RepID=A0A8S4SEG6_9NEOP|nr:jg8327 [Pararge aegeria aegeria]